ncbi:hypothetical protein N9L06_02405 [Mariniblastus sp.]|nr:hypothetical protein [Mariniblastus sp.]
MIRKRKRNFAEQSALKNLIRQPAASDAERVLRCKTVFDHVLNNSHCIASPDFQTVSPADLGLLFQATDELFFEGLVGKICERVAAKPLAFRLSTRMTSTGGMTTMQKSAATGGRKFEFEIAVATTPLFETFRTAGAASVGGVKCDNRLQALQRIMEHEMVHLIELLMTDDSNCSAEPFRRIVRNFFGHTQSKHQLLTPSDTARNRFGISPGDRVRFKCGQKTLYGVLHRVTKRATVLVKDGNGTPYDDGCKYSKYYVPLKLLRRA